PIDAALVPPLKRSRDVRHTLTALPALPQLSLLFRREPCPCMPLHSHTSSSAKIRRCCVDSLNSPPLTDISTPLNHGNCRKEVGAQSHVRALCPSSRIHPGRARPAGRVLGNFLTDLRGA